MGNVMKEIIVVGSGFSGSIIARKLAEEENYKVRIIEQRPHIAGNMYDYVNEYGVMVHKYGPHLINTNMVHVIEFLEKYTELIPFAVKLLSLIDGRYVQLPFNYLTMQQLVGYKQASVLLEKMRKEFANRSTVSIFELINHHDSDIKNYRTLLYEKAYKTYTAKQWDLDPEQLDKSVLDRVKMRLNYEERYLNADFQFVPKDGYTALFENLLSHPNIQIELNTDALEHIRFNEENKKVLYDGQEIEMLIFTGAIDELFGLEYGALPYRSLEFEYESQKTDSILPTDILSCPSPEVPYTRITEYNKINGQPKGEYATIAKEYSMPYDKNADRGNLPYYPVVAKENLELFQRYTDKADQYSNLFLCGRLADYKYYNMDWIINHTLRKYEALKEKLRISSDLA